MHIHLTRREPGGIAFTIIYGVIALLALLAARYLPVAELMPGCIFTAITGFPCPTCGSTRSLVLLSHGRLLAAFAMNPLVAGIVVFLVVALIGGTLFRLCHWPRIGIVLSALETDRIRRIGLLVLVINWLYLIFTL